MSDLFEHVPASSPPSPARALSRAKRWRRPGRGEQPCRDCGSAASCFIGDAGFCVWCTPEDYWPNGRPAWL